MTPDEWREAASKIGEPISAADFSKLFDAVQEIAFAPWWKVALWRFQAVIRRLFPR